MRRMAFAVLAVATALFTGLFTASVAGAQAPAATVSVTGDATTWSPPNVTVTTGETVRWSFEGATLPHNVHGTSANWNPPLQSAVGTGQAPVDYTFNAPGVYTFVCDVHPTTMTGTVTVEDAGADPLENVLVFSETAGFRHDSIDEGIAAIQALGAANDFAVDRDRGLDAVQRRQPRPVRRGRLPLHDRRRPHRHASRTRSRTTCAPAAASSASTPRPTRSTRGRGTARWSAATSATTRPAPPRRRSTSRIPTSRRRRACRPLGCGRTSGTTTSRRRTRWWAAAGTTTRRAPAASRSSRPSTSRRTTSRTATPPTTITRSRGARTSTAAASGTRAWATRRSRSAPARATSVSTSSAACRP